MSQVARMLNVPRSTLYDWVRTGRLDTVRVGEGSRQMVLIPRTAIERFIDAHEVAAGKPNSSDDN